VEITGDANCRTETRRRLWGTVGHHVCAVSAFYLGGDRLKPVEQAGGTYNGECSAHFRAADIWHGCANDWECQSNWAEIHRGLGVKAVGEG
jgi:hypothetical protein